VHITTYGFSIVHRSLMVRVGPASLVLFLINRDNEDSSMTLYILACNTQPKNNDTAANKKTRIE